MTASTLPAATIALTDGTAATARLHLDGLAPGERGSESLTVRYRDDVDATVALYVRAEHAHGGAPATGHHCEAADLAHCPAARRVRVGVFERTGALLPFPVFTGTLADLVRLDGFEHGVGRWTGRGDGRDHDVTYEVTWRPSRDATGPGEAPADVELVVEARH
ncbi:hypothetical protein ACIBF1_24475 [Spirillospora sp. NPDC050679]